MHNITYIPHSRMTFCEACTGCCRVSSCVRVFARAHERTFVFLFVCVYVYVCTGVFVCTYECVRQKKKYVCYLS